MIGASSRSHYWWSRCCSSFGAATARTGAHSAREAETMFSLFKRVEVKHKTPFVWKALAVVGMAAVGVGIAYLRRRLISRLTVTRRRGGVQVRASVGTRRARNGRRTHTVAAA
jgi:hypothetical protein